MPKWFGPNPNILYFRSNVIITKLVSRSYIWTLFIWHFHSDSPHSNFTIVVIVVCIYCMSAHPGRGKPPLLFFLRFLGQAVLYAVQICKALLGKCVICDFVLYIKNINFYWPFFFLKKKNSTVCICIDRYVQYRSTQIRKTYQMSKRYPFTSCMHVLPSSQMSHTGTHSSDHRRTVIWFKSN